MTTLFAVEAKRDHPLLQQIIQLVAGAAATGIGFAQHTACQQVADISQRGILRALGDGGPLAGSQLAVETIEQEAFVESF